VQQKHLTTLEYPKILEKLAGFASFSASKELALSLRPSPFFNQVSAWQAETTEADRLLTVKVNIGVGGARDVRPYVARCRRGQLLNFQEFLQVRQTLISARELSRTLARLADDYPRLADIAHRIEPCAGLVNQIGQTIDENGEVKNSASQKLGRIRRDLDIAHQRLMEKLNRIISSSSVNQYLQESLLTQRSGRYVIPVKADFKGKVQGVVHDQSASGATLFVEPLATVELNNRLRNLEMDEDEEVRRILAELATQVAEHGSFITHTIEALAELDLAFAKAKFAYALDAVEPDLIPEGIPGDNIRLVLARHPLLPAKSVVPISVDLSDETRMLVITGPNTGGKTVSLKTVGLLIAMAQSGLRIPAEEGSRVRVFHQIFADIGDEQSIEQSLSTFSAHMTNVVRILSDCDPQSLVIFDELGAGTDPVEGSALARAILSDLLERQVITFVATHYSELKAFAHTTPGVANASMEFDVETLSPTYRLRIGLPGASNAFTITQRLGLSEQIINDARGLVGENTRQVEAMLAEIKGQTETARQIRREAEETRHSLEKRLAEIDQERRDILNSAREDARREIKQARERVRTLEREFQAELDQQRTELLTPASRQKSVLRVTADIDGKLDDLTERATPVAQKKDAPSVRKDAPIKPGPIRVGDAVFVAQFSTAGEVVGIQDDQAEVQLGHFRTTVPLRNLERRKKKEVAFVEEQASLPPAVESPGMELDLRGQVAEDSILSLDHYLDHAFRARLPWVSIIHGRGSGKLRQVVRQELQRHPLVSSYRAGKSEEGGDGVTVARLAIT
jgi:DNA mismatch repair protein MutS2